MNGDGQSDSPVVPAKPANKPAGGETAHTQAGAESVEERGLAKGNTASAARSGHGAGNRAPRALDRVRQVAKRDKEVKFTALLHHVDVEALRAAFGRLRRQAAPGEDGVRWKDYERDLEENLQDLHDRIHRGAYRPRPSRRVFIPKADGRQRPLGIATTEDKIVQSAVVEVLNAIYEADFLGFSYGFRPGCKPHDALDALTTGILRKKVNWVLDADIRDFFTSLDHGWLEKFVEHRIGDKRVLRLIQKWLKAGVVEDGIWAESEEGTPQGATVSPLLANVYLHYVFDQWVERWRRQQSHGDMIVVRYADDFVVGFEHREDAERFQAELSERLAKFGLELKAEKTRLIEFGRFAAHKRAARGLGKPETFDFLGFTHISGKNRFGRFEVRRKTIAKRMRAKLKEVKAELMRRMHLPIPEVGRWLGSVVRGHFAYYAVPGNLDAIRAFRDQVRRCWWKALGRRSQRTSTTWERTGRIADRWLPTPRSMHPFPQQRFDVHHPRQEPSAVVPLAGIYAGGRP
ncbi:MAG TPA: group II intron reverse transcriptase/maturase [Thermoanaerobaculia bacterium]|nr:group II intron reverse transcriptase/maturase [Thermoanaerobaculia bacterium]